MTWAILPATDEHAGILAPRVTAADAAECWAMAHIKPLDALKLSIRHSFMAYTWVIDGEPACMYGISIFGLLDETGYPWMLGTDLVKRHYMPFLRNYRRQLDDMLSMFTTLETYVDARHKVCLRWLKWTGFEIEPPEPFGLDQLMFHRVLLRK